MKLKQILDCSLKFLEHKNTNAILGQTTSQLKELDNEKL